LKRLRDSDVEKFRFEDAHLNFARGFRIGDARGCNEFQRWFIRRENCSKLPLKRSHFFGNDAARDALAFECVTARAAARVP
jgi:hypothetical protein